jgi:hypothetical protein
MRFLLSLLLTFCAALSGAEKDAPTPIAPSPAEKALVPEEKKADKSQYNLFHPTPRDLMREMSTDRPDLTESPYTVDAGHFQIESDIINFTRERRDAEHSSFHSDNFSFGATNFKMGLTNRIDLQLVFDGWQIQNERDRDDDGVIFKETRQGVGDLTTRLKINVFGNDSGKVALGVMPFIKFPTNQEDLGNNKVEGGVIIPVGVELPHGWSMGFQTEVDFLAEDDGDHYFEFFNTMTFSHSIIGNLGGYMEVTGAVNTLGEPWAGTVDGGFTYGFTDDIQLDFGCNFGITRAANDYQPFLGLSIRF